MHQGIIHVVTSPHPRSRSPRWEKRTRNKSPIDIATPFFKSESSPINSNKTWPLFEVLTKIFEGGSWKCWSFYNSHREGELMPLNKRH